MQYQNYYFLSTYLKYHLTVFQLLLKKKNYSSTNAKAFAIEDVGAKFDLFDK